MSQLTIKHIHESNLIEGIDSEVADSESWDAWNWLIARDDIARTTIERLQKRITHHQDNLKPAWRGHFRTFSGQEVSVGGRQCLPAAQVAAAMKLWLSAWLKIGPKKAHIEFERIHPFVDGNGRTGRMLMWWQEIKAGKEPTLIRYKNRGEYYDWFVDYDNLFMALAEGDYK